MKVTRSELIGLLMDELIYSQEETNSCRFEGQWKIFYSKTMNRNVYFNSEEGVFDFQIENSPRFTNDEEFEISEPTIKENLTLQEISTNEENSAVEKEEDETQTRNRPSYKTLCEEKDAKIEQLRTNLRVITDSNNTLNEWFLNATKEKEELQKQVDSLTIETEELSKERYNLQQENEKLKTKNNEKIFEFIEEELSGTFESIENEINEFMSKKKHNVLIMKYVKDQGITRFELDELAKCQIQEIVNHYENRIGLCNKANEELLKDNKIYAKKANFLDCLESQGVDNWCGYDEARKEFNELYVEDDE